MAAPEEETEKLALEAFLQARKTTADPQTSESGAFTSREVIAAAASGRHVKLEDGAPLRCAV